MFRRLGRTAVLLIGLVVAGGAAPPPSGVVMPPGSRIGMVPPDGFTVARTFSGFEHPASSSSIVFSEAAADAYERLRGGLNAEGLARQGITLKGREDLAVGTARGALYRAEQASGAAVYDKWIALFPGPGFTGVVTINTLRQTPARLSDVSVRAALGTLRLAQAPQVDPRAALPFTFRETGKLKVDRILLGNRVILLDSTDPKVAQADWPIMTIRQSLGTASASVAERDIFARSALTGESGLGDVKITRSAQTRVDGMPAIELEAECVNVATKAPCIAFQSVAFAADGYYRFVGMAPRAQAAAMLKDFRALVASFRRKKG